MSQNPYADLANNFGSQYTPVIQQNRLNAMNQLINAQASQKGMSGNEFMKSQLNPVVQTEGNPLEGSSGAGPSYFCSRLYRMKRIPKSDYKKLKRAYWLTAFLHPSFSLWYLKNGSKLLKMADESNYDFSIIEELLYTRVRKAYFDEGYSRAFELYREGLEILRDRLAFYELEKIPEGNRWKDFFHFLTLKGLIYASRSN